MAESNLIQALLDGLPAYGPQLLALAAFCCAVGIPLPIPLLVLATGALVRQGGVNPLWAGVGCLAGSLLGASIYYAAGRHAGTWVQAHAGRWVSGAWRKAQERFGAQAALTIYLTRFLLTPIGIPTNLVAGSGRYAYWRFALSALAGDLMWVAGYGLAGYLMGSRWQTLSSAMSSYAGGIAGVVAIALVLWHLWRNRAHLAPFLR